MSTCPECGSPVAPGSAVCAQCGFPLRPDAVGTFGGPPRPGQSGGNRMVFWILGIAALGLIVVMGIGVVAALAIPRFARTVDRARTSELQATAMLKIAWTSEQTYRAQNGAYASTLEDLRGVGWEEPPDSSAYELSVVSWGEGTLCIEAASRSGVTTLSIQDDGRIEHVGCSTSSSTSTDAAEDARGVLRDGWRLLNAHRESHGSLPTDLSGIEPKIEQQQALARFRLGYQRYANGEFCLSLRPRAVVGPERSVDQDGRFFTGSACQGSVVESFASQTAGRDTGAAP